LAGLLGGVEAAGHCFVSAKFGPLMIFSKRWFEYDKIMQGDMNEYQKEAIA
jgi:hypothetical protein